MIDIRGAILLTADVLALALVVLHPLRRRFDASDRGQGNVVVLPPAYQATLWRDGLFTLVAIAGSIVLIGLRYPDLSATYRVVVAHLGSQVVHQPAVMANYAKTLRPIIPISVLAFVIAMSIAMPASPARRIAVLMHAPLALAMGLVADAWLAIFGLTTHVPLGPFPLISILLHFTIAYMLGMRLALTSFQLPRPTQVPVRREGNSADNAITILVVGAVFLALGVAAVWLLHLDRYDPVTYAFVIIALPAYVKFGIYVMLSVLRLFSGPLPEPSANPPPIEVIAPAFNEEANIQAWVEHIDTAAEVYGGPVRILLCDDGSTDATRELAETALSRCQAATGEVISGGHRGKATALNLALSRCRADYVIRHDSDCLVHPNAFRYTIPWLEADPKVGLVGAFMLPKMPFTSWIDRMRALELAVGFGMPRLGYSVIDSQPCVPGNYTAFRREAALELGGYPEGMWGEDIDFTCNMARLGYRAVYDRRVWAYEDVPQTIEDLRIQRRRWNRGSVHNFARFIPLAVGSCGPRFWFVEFLRAARRLVMPLQFAAYLFVIQAAFFRPTSRINIAHLLVFYVVAKLPMLIFVVISMAYRGLARTVPWWPLFLVFALIKRLANLEALLSFPFRPVHSSWSALTRRSTDRTEPQWPVLRPRYLPAPG